MSQVREVNDSNFESEVLNSDRPTVVDFWAEWCGPCRMVAPEIEKLAQMYDGVINVRKMDVDANQVTAGRFGIMSIPTVMLFAPGEQPVPAIGFRPAEQMIQALGLDKYATATEIEA